MESVYNNQPRDQKIVTIVDRWLLYVALCEKMDLKIVVVLSESCGLAVEQLAHNRKVVGLIPVQCYLYGSGVKAMPGPISATNSGSL